MTGREQELRVIDDVLSGSERRGVVIAGRAGVGKTRLAREAAAAMAARGWSVSRLTGTATARPVPLGAFARWIEDFTAAPLAMVRQVIAALTAGCGAGPRLLVVDDAPILDDLSALVVQQLVCEDLAMLITTARIGEPAPDAVTSLWKDGLLRRLELQPLSRSESEICCGRFLACASAPGLPNGSGS